MSNQIQSLKRILVITKFGYLGDTIVATPFLRRLREAASQAHITLLSGPAIPELLRGCPYIDRFEILDRKQQGTLATAARLRESNYEAVFLVNRSLHTGILAALARIPLRIGHDTELRGFSLNVRVPYDWNKPDRECALDLLAAVGAPAEPAMPELWVSVEESSDALSRLSGLGIVPGELLIGMQPGANDSYVREWRAEGFAEVADHLANDADARILLFGSPAERAVSEQVARLTGSSPIILTGTTSLREALALISNCRLWIGNDSGLLHVAVALGVPTVGIFGPTKAKRWSYEGDGNKTLVSYPATSARDPKTIRESLDSITVNSVYQAAIELLKKWELKHDSHRNHPRTPCCDPAAG